MNTPSRDHMPAVKYSLSPSIRTPLRAGQCEIIWSFPISLASLGPPRNFQTGSPLPNSRQYRCPSSDATNTRFPSITGANRIGPSV